jgi:RsmE family RNA methyltransferase
MRHEPHLYVPGPWRQTNLSVSDGASRHLNKVLRYTEGSPVSYTDGRGLIGTGRWTNEGVERGEERTAPRKGRTVDVIVAPPSTKERQRFLVEKCQEIGVRRLAWLSARLASGRPPAAAKAAAWSVGAMEQSRGAWLMEILGPTDAPAGGGVLVADVSGTPISEVSLPPEPVTIVVGPEGGLAIDEIDPSIVRVKILDTILRIETAAVVAAAILRST